MGIEKLQNGDAQSQTLSKIWICRDRPFWKFKKLLQFAFVNHIYNQNCNTKCLIFFESLYYAVIQYIEYSTAEKVETVMDILNSLL